MVTSRRIKSSEEDDPPHHQNTGSGEGLVWVGCSFFSLWNAVFVLLLLLVNDGKIVYLLMCGQKILERVYRRFLKEFSIHNGRAFLSSLEVSENFRDEGIVSSFWDFMFGPVTLLSTYVLWFHFPLLLLSCYTFWTYAKKTIIETSMTVVNFNLRTSFIL